MEDSATQTHAHCRCTRIQLYNDRLRQTGEGGLIMMTRGVRALSGVTLPTILKLLADYDDFNADNDPHQEHDLGDLDIDGISLLWKIDYYDPSMKFASRDPGNQAATRRVLTVMLAEEY